MYANTAASVNTPVTKIHRSVVKIKNEFANMYSKINKYNGTLATAVSDYAKSVSYLGRPGDWETRIETLESAQLKIGQLDARIDKVAIEAAILPERIIENY